MREPRARVRCVPGAGGLRCEVTLRATFENVGTRTVTLPDGVVDLNADEILVDGAPFRAEHATLSPGERRAFEWRDRYEEELQDQPYAVFEHLAEVEPLRMRHPWLADGRDSLPAPRVSVRVLGRIQLSELYAWAETAPIAVEADVPEGYEGEVPGDLTVRRPDHPVAHGGPFVAFGATFDGSARVQAGYEVGLRRDATALIGALAIDVHTVDDPWVTLALTIEAATPSVWFAFPSISLGVGLPVRIYPDPRPGVRFVATATWFVGVSAFVDIWPDVNDTLYDVSILGRLSF